MKILFVAEGVTLAQIVRLVTLARALDPAEHEVHFACARFDEAIFGGTSFVRHEIHSLAAETVEAAIAAGKPIYDLPTLSGYLEEDRALLDRVRPDRVIGDLRWTLAVAAPLAKIRYAALINAYWSPYTVDKRIPLPEHPIVEKVGVEMAEKFFPYAWPLAARSFAAPLNKLRKRHGLAAIGSLREILTYGDDVLYADVPELVPTRDLPAHHHWLGAVDWSPDVPAPAWLDSIEGPIAYVTLGSSGKVDRLPIVLPGVRAAGLTPVVATAGRIGLPEGVLGADFLPGALMARRAALVVTNGGSSTGYQALAEGVPVLGVPYNLDQYLAMAAIAKAGAGVLVRSGTATAESVREAAVHLREEAPRAAARRVAESLAAHDCRERFRALMRR